MLPSFFLAALTAALLAPTAVSAHGYVKEVVVDGKSYSGWLPFTDPYASPVPSRIVRKIPGDGPVMDVSNPDIACNQGGEKGAGLVADAAAGSKVTFKWTTWPADHLGPVSTYMTSCDGDCKNFDATSAKWFKVDAAGYSNGQWASTKLIADGNSWTSTIPSELKPGQYLMRHEIVALHDAGAPQYYPSCSQIQVTGSGSKYPSGSSLVSIPGLYENTQWPDIWSDSFKSFAIPGPAVAFSGSSDSGSNDNNASSSVPSSSKPATSTSAASSTKVATSTKVPTTATSSADNEHPTSASTSSSPSTSSTGRCNSRRRRRMVKRHVAHLAKSH